MIRFVSVDLETTGLEPERDQILEVAAITDDGKQFHRIVHWTRVEGHPIAMAMNARLMESISNPARSLGIRDVILDLEKWLEQWTGRKPAKATAAGKNFGSFDLQFLLRAGLRKETFRHRCLDPASWFAIAEDEVLPDLKTCVERAGVPWALHEAFGDAEAVRQLVFKARELGLFRA